MVTKFRPITDDGDPPPTASEFGTTVYGLRYTNKVSRQLGLSVPALETIGFSTPDVSEVVTSYGMR